MNTVLTSGPDDARHMARTILVVDDETTLRETLVEALELEGYRAIPAADGREALIRIAGRPARPRPAGPDAAGAVRHGGVPDPARGVPRPDHHAHRPRRRGGQGRGPRARRGRLRDQAVQPPRAHRPDPCDLPARRAEGRDPSPVAARRPGPGRGDFADPASCATAVEPIAREFELLSYLVRNPGQVFTRDQLLEKVWGYDYVGETRTVDVHVHWLRAELEQDPAAPDLLQTVRGVGYVFRRPPA